MNRCDTQMDRCKRTETMRKPAITVHFRAVAFQTCGFRERFAVPDADFAWSNQRRYAGRMCEVGPPASGLSFFTSPYSRRGRSTVHPALRGYRLPPVGE